MLSPSKRLLAFVALLTVAPVWVSAAGAAPSPATQVKRLRSELRATRDLQSATARKLKKTRATLASTKSQLTAAQAQLAATQSQLQTAQTQLAATQAQLAATQAQLAATQTLLNAIPEPIVAAELQVEHEVTWAEGQAPGPNHDLYTAVSAMNYVVGHVSTGEYGYLLGINFQFPASWATGDPTADSILSLQAGICGQASITFAAIMTGLGYSVRSAQFYYATPSGNPDSHIAVEVYYGGGWHFFDPTFGVYWADATTGSVLSIDAVRSKGGAVEHKDDATFTNLVENPWYSGDDSAFETDPATQVVIGEQTFPG
jgi:hypothetical protein